MKIIFLGEYSNDAIVSAPIKVGRTIFNLISEKGIRTFYLPYFQDGKKYSRFQKLFGFQSVTRKVYRTGLIPLLAFVVKFRPEIIHINTPGLYYTILFPLKKLLRFKIVSTLHAINRYVIPHFSDLTGYNRFRFLLIEKLLLKHSDLILVYSERDKRYVTRYYNISPFIIKVVNNGIKLMDIKQEDFSFLLPLKIAFVGDINRKEKGFDLLAKALAYLNCPTIISLYGHDIQNREYQNLSSNIELKFYQPLNEVEFREALIKNDLFILSSRYESFSISLLEAMNTGIIPIVSDRVGLIEKLPVEIKDFIFRRNDANHLLDRMRYFQTLNLEEKVKLSSKIIDFTKKFSWEFVVEDYYQMYKMILTK